MKRVHNGLGRLNVGRYAISLAFAACTPILYRNIRVVLFEIAKVDILSRVHARYNHYLNSIARPRI
jgi:hypothetical protein